MLKLMQISFIGLLVLPLADLKIKFIPQYPLKGVTEPVKKMKLTPQSWLNRSFQKTVEKQIVNNFGGKSILVRTENQLNFSFFSQLSANTNDPIIKGKENWLYENSYIQCWLLKEAVKKDEVLPYLQGFKELQEILKSMNKTLLLLISPSKPHLCPEFLPEDIYLQKDFNKIDNYSSTLPLLKELSINYIDGPEIFRNFKGSQLLFPKGGTHWSYYGAAIVLEKIFSLAQKVSLEKEYPEPFIESDYQPESIVGTDNDLGDLINIWQTNSTILPMSYPNLKISNNDSANPSNVLLVGSSFTLTIDHLLDSLPDYFPNREILYYYNRLITTDDTTYQGTNKFDIKELINKTDIIILEINQSMLPIVGWMSFVRDALITLKKDS